MNDDPTRDEFIDARLKAAAGTALAVPRRRLLLPTSARDGSRDRHRRRAVLAFVAVNAVMVALGFGAAFGVLELSRSHDVTAPAVRPSPRSTTFRIATTVELPSITVDRDGAEDLGPIAIGSGSIWVAMSGQGSVLRIDMRTGHVVATIPIGVGTSLIARDRWRRYPTAVAVGPDGSIWVTANAEKAIVRIDPLTNHVVESIDIGVEPTSLAVDASTVWVAADSDQVVLAVDIAQRRVTHRLAIANASSISISAGSVWVVAKADGSVVRIDETTGATIATIGSPSTYEWTWIAVRAGSSGVWAIDQSNSCVAKIDESSSAVTQRVSVRTPPRSVAVGSRTVWVATSASLLRIDTATSAVASAPLIGIESLATDGDGVWALVGSSPGSAHLVHLVGLTP